MRAAVLAITAAAALAATACAPLTAKSSASVLGPERSTTVVRRAHHEAADEIVQLLAARDYEVAYVRQLGEVIALRFEGNRTLLPETGTVHEIGSAYYAFLAPHGPGLTSIALIGRPIYNGAELCTSDLRLADTGCSQRFGNALLEPQLDGRAEATVVEGVFAVLRSRGIVAEAEVPAHRRTLRDACLAQRKGAACR